MLSARRQLNSFQHGRAGGSVDLAIFPSKYYHQLFKSQIKYLPEWYWKLKIKQNKKTKMAFTDS